MDRSIPAGLVLLVMAGMVCAGVAAAASLPIRTPAQIAAAARINTDISAVSRAVGACAAASPSPGGCVCRFPAELQALRSTYADALERFPAWKGRTITWQDPASHDTVVLALDALERQLEVRCP